MLLLENYQPSKRLKISVNNKDTDVENIYMNETSSINYEYFNLRRKYMITQVEAFKESDEFLIQEANVKFLSGMGEILKKFIELVKTMFNKFISFMKNSVDLTLSFINKEKVNIYKLTNTDIKFKGFIFKLDNKPVYEFNRLTQKQPFVLDKDFIESLNSSDIKNLESELKEDYYYDIIRGLVLNSYKSIQKSDFSDEIKKAFRNGETKEKEINFDDYSTVEDLIKSITKTEEIINEIRSERDKAIKELENLQDYFKKLIKIDIRPNFNTKVPDFTSYINNGGKYQEYNFTDNKQVDNLRKYGIARSNEVRNISKIITEVFAGKIQAVKDKYSQDCKILRKLILNN